ncbi:Sec-independent protein translocase protein TatB [Phenylobacterium sp.]|uniref:Sec-independent protein translocase protein TatB n=1 Tax=Phenylobacterium sp. TaxID=1871053 RepID=UPI002DE7F0AD|nr:Sec-independent protein translocase protein TatB [Phenylobacterium sp.]
MFLEGKTLELMIAAVVALIVVGPKDLPVLLRKFGQFMARLRGMAAEFRASFDEMARQSELDELRKEVEALRQGQLADIAAHAGGAETSQIIDDIHQGLADVGVQLHPPMSYQYAEAAAEAPPVTVAAKPKPRAKAAAAKTTAKPKPKAPVAKTPVAKKPATKTPAARKPAAKAPAARKAKP